MSGVNKVILIGNLGAEPEVRQTSGDTTVANLRIATNEVWKDRDGNKQEHTEWHRVVMFGKLAELADKYLSKGRQVYIEGKIQTREWQDKEGARRFTTEIVGQQMTFLGGDSNGSGRAPDQERSAPVDTPAPDDDIPF